MPFGMYRRATRKGNSAQFLTISSPILTCFLVDTLVHSNCNTVDGLSEKKSRKTTKNNGISSAYAVATFNNNVPTSNERMAARRQLLSRIIKGKCFNWFALFSRLHAIKNKVTVLEVVREVAFTSWQSFSELQILKHSRYKRK